MTDIQDHKAKPGLEIVAYLYDCNTVEFRVKDALTGRIIADCCATIAEAEAERDAYLDEMHAFNAGPFAGASQ